MTSVLVYDSKRNNPLGFFARLVCDAIAAQPGVTIARLAGPWEIGEALSRGSYDLILIFGGEELSGAVLEPLRAECRCLAVWTTEDPYEFDQILQHEDAFDIVFSNDARCAARYRNGHYLGLGFPDTLIAHLAPQPKVVDFIYIGKGWPNRVEIMKNVLDATEGLSRRIIVTDPTAPFALHPDIAVDRKLPYTSYLSLIAAARTCLIVGRDYTTSLGPNSEARSISPPPRLFECVGLGTVPVVLGQPLEPSTVLAGAGPIYCDDPSNLRAALDTALASIPVDAEAARPYALSTATAILVETFRVYDADPPRRP